jgi:WD40 repeat protein
LAFAPRGKILATVSQTAPESLQLWDLSTGLAVRALKSRPFSRAIAFSPDGAILAVDHFDGNFSLWDPATGHSRATHKGHNGMIFGLAFSADGTLLATASRDGTAKVWDVPATTLGRSSRED